MVNKLFAARTRTRTRPNPYGAFYSVIIWQHQTHKMCTPKVMKDFVKSALSMCVYVAYGPRSLYTKIHFVHHDFSGLLFYQFFAAFGLVLAWNPSLEWLPLCRCYLNIHVCSVVLSLCTSIRHSSLNVNHFSFMLFRPSLYKTSFWFLPAIRSYRKTIRYNEVCFAA